MKIMQFTLFFALTTAISTININAWQLMNGSQSYDIEYKFLDICDPNDLAGPNPEEFIGVLKSGGTKMSHTFCGENRGTNPWGIPAKLAVRRYGWFSGVTAWWKEIDCRSLLNLMQRYVANHPKLKYQDPKTIEFTWIIIEDGSSWKVVPGWEDPETGTFEMK
jgi:hypothetical protein